MRWILTIVVLPLLVSAAPPALRVVWPAPGRPLALADGRSMMVTSVLVSGRLTPGAWLWSDAGVPSGRVTIVVDRARRTLSVFRAGREIGVAVVETGADRLPTPRGVFPVLARLRDHASSLYDARMPYTLRLTGDGISIHATEVRDGRVTHGCIGVPLPFARRLFEAVHVGDLVSID